MVRDTVVQSQPSLTKASKMVLDATLTHSIIRYGSRVKWNNSRSGVVSSPTH